MSVPTTLSEILVSIEQFIQAANITDTNSVYISLNAKPPQYPAADQVFVIVPGRTEVEQDYVMGGGNYTTFMKTDIEIWLFSNFGTDERNRDDSWLNDATYGSLQALNSLIYSLQFASFVSDGSLINDVPFKLQSIDKPVRELVAKGFGEGWGGICSRWLVKWWQILPVPTGQPASQPLLQTVGYSCISGICMPVENGGTFPTLAQCQEGGCS